MNAILRLKLGPIVEAFASQIMKAFREVAMEALPFVQEVAEVAQGPVAAPPVNQQVMGRVARLHEDKGQKKAVSPEEAARRSAIAKKAALTRKHRAAAQKAAKTRAINAAKGK